MRPFGSQQHAVGSKIGNSKHRTLVVPIACAAACFAFAVPAVASAHDCDPGAPAATSAEWFDIDGNRGEPPWRDADFAELRASSSIQIEHQPRDLLIVFRGGTVASERCALMQRHGLEYVSTVLLPYDVRFYKVADQALLLPTMKALTYESSVLSVGVNFIMRSAVVSYVPTGLSDSITSQLQSVGPRRCALGSRRVRSKQSRKSRCSSRRGTVPRELGSTAQTG